LHTICGYVLIGKMSHS